MRSAFKSTKRFRLRRWPQLSRMFAGTDALNFHRLADLPLDFKAKWDAARVAVRGGRVYEADDLAVIRGFALMPTKQMVRMTSPRRLVSVRKAEA